MMPLPRPYRLLPLFLLLAACAGPVTMGPQADSAALAQETALQKQLVFERAVKDDARVFSVMYPLLGANAPFCAGHLRPMAGLLVWNIDSVAPQWRAAANTAYALDDRLAVETVARASPALKAGLRSGDIIESINGEKLAGPGAATAFAQILAAAGTAPVSIAYRRGAQQRTASFAALPGCDFPARVDQDSSDVNAAADGRSIAVTRGMLRFVENDDELALVLAHELAHNALSHVDKQRQNQMAGALGGLLIDSVFAAGGIATGGEFSQMGGAMAQDNNSVAFEQEADYVGMYFMERAGYSAAGVANFWRRMATEDAASVTARQSHPTTPERFLAIEKTYAEISAKKKAHQPLVPNFK